MPEKRYAKRDSECAGKAETFECDGVKVNMRFSDSDRTVEDALVSYLKALKRRSERP